MEGMVIHSTFWQNKRVLVTGHTGFKGAWLTLWLLKMGADVWGYSLPPAEGALFNDLFKDYNTNNASYPGTLNSCIGDINDLITLKEYVRRSQPQVVFHLAAQPLVRQSYADPLSTWSVNLLGSLNTLEALRVLEHNCAVVMVTTDKVYSNHSWDYGYREVDQLGGLDPYSASKAAAEIAIHSWRKSFCGKLSRQKDNLSICTVRAGNVIGGGDFAVDRIVPDCVRALSNAEPIKIRFPKATRPWQHVLDPLNGYMILAQRLYESEECFSSFASAFNFGPLLQSNRSVQTLVETFLLYWPGNWIPLENPHSPEEASRLHLQIDKSFHQLNWLPKWGFHQTVKYTAQWYLNVFQGEDPISCCTHDLSKFLNHENIEDLSY